MRLIMLAMQAHAHVLSVSLSPVLRLRNHPSTTSECVDIDGDGATAYFHGQSVKDCNNKKEDEEEDKKNVNACKTPLRQIESFRIGKHTKQTDVQVLCSQCSQLFWTFSGLRSHMASGIIIIIRHENCFRLNDGSPGCGVLCVRVRLYLLYVYQRITLTPFYLCISLALMSH